MFSYPNGGADRYLTPDVQAAVKEASRQPRIRQLALLYSTRGTGLSLTIQAQRLQRPARGGGLARP